MNARLCLLLAFMPFAGIGRASGQSSGIIHHEQQCFLWPSQGGRGWDLDDDGAEDFLGFGTIYGDGWCDSSSYMLIGTGTNQLLLWGTSDVALIPEETLVGGDPPANSSWGNYDQWGWGNMLTRLDSCRGPEGWVPNTDAWIGNFSTQCIGFIGLRFYQTDGLHYGWARVRALTFRDLNSFVLADGLYTENPVILDWAYESHPNIPIMAGDKGSFTSSGDGRIAVTNGAVPLDMNLDARPDMRFLATNGGFAIELLNGASLAFSSDWADGAHRLKAGTPIGPETNFGDPTFRLLSVRTCGDCGCFGWTSPEGYLGVRLQRHGLIHYGWVQVAIPPDDQPGVFLLDWAWNHHPRRPILAGGAPDLPGAADVRVCGGRFGSRTLSGQRWGIPGCRHYSDQRDGATYDGKDADIESEVNP
jgi:hypothetical protein